MSNAIVLLSGGIDSAVAAAYAKQTLGPAPIQALFVDYGQPHLDAELYSARKVAKSLGISFTATIVNGLYNHALTTDNPVVPYRNMTFLTVAAAMAAQARASTIIIGCNGDDAEVFPDCRPGFLTSMQKTLEWAHPTVRLNLWAPLSGMTKVDVVEMGRKLEVDLELTHSCYTPKRSPEGWAACGKCAACELREGALGVTP